MNDEKEVLKKYKIIPKKISYKNKVKIIETENKKYCLKNKERSNDAIFEYLNTHNFLNYLKQINDSSTNYELYSYIEEIDIEKEEKAYSLINIMSILHNKTTTYIDIDYEKVNTIYEDITNKINELLSYYYDLQDKIESTIYMSPAEYHLIRNINVLYISLNNARSDIDNWYKLKKTLKKERQVLLHNNMSLEHFLKSDKEYLINWNKSKKGTVIYDFFTFCKNEYKTLNIQKMYQIYQQKYKYNKDEKLLLFSLLQLPWKIMFDKSNYINTLEVNELLDYLKKVNSLILEEHKENQKT